MLQSMMTNLNLTNLKNANANLNNYNNSPSKLILPQLNASVVSGGSGGGSASLGSGNTAGSLPISASNTLNSK